MGALITVLITTILLNRQSEAAQVKERNVELLRRRLDVYEAPTFCRLSTRVLWDRMRPNGWSRR
jgi:hypothetical protein